MGFKRPEWRPLVQLFFTEIAHWSPQFRDHCFCRFSPQSVFNVCPARSAALGWVQGWKV